MATKNRTAPPTHSYSLISDDTFRQIHAAMAQLRSRARGMHASANGLEAVLAATTLQLRTGDLVFASDGLLPAMRSADSTHAPPVMAVAHLALATGAAMGRKTAGGDGVVMVFSSAAPANRRAWQEALQLAGKHRLPLIFVLPQRKGTRAARETASIASEAMSFGVTAIPVDTIDAVAIYRVAFESLARARRGTGATLIACTHYALEDGPQHKAPLVQDPLVHMKAYLRGKGLLKAASQKKKTR